MSKEKQLEKRVQLLEMALIKICQTANYASSDDRPATNLEETIEQIVVVDLNLDPYESDDIYGEALKEYEASCG